MTLKQFIDNFFENRVNYDYEKSLFYSQDFWDAWDLLLNDIDTGGVQWACEWYEDAPELTPLRESLVRGAIDKYIKVNLQPVYTNC